jgi:hypothetical protein
MYAHSFFGEKNKFDPTTAKHRSINDIFKLFIKILLANTKKISNVYISHLVKKTQV